MAEEGKTVVFISHKLHEVLAVADRITVLRGGRTVETVAAEGATPRSLASLMVGREIEVTRPLERTRPLPDVRVLEVEGLTVPGDRGETAVSDVSFAIREGEIVGVAGVAGNGQRELAEAISGIRMSRSGHISVGGRVLHGGDPREAIRAGVAHVPEDRLGTGLAPSLSVTSNVVIKTYRRRSLSHGPLLDLRRMRDAALGVIRGYDVKTPGPETPVRNLSGGNLQKLVLGREFSDEPLVLVVAQPTRGLDVGAIETVHAYLRDAAAKGVGILLMSEDLDELRALSDRILVVYEGAVVGELAAGQASIEEIGYLMAGGERS
jgi:simple sugar transport system ATP-binding protein